MAKVMNEAAAKISPILKDIDIKNYALKSWRNACFRIHCCRSRPNWVRASCRRFQSGFTAALLPASIRQEPQQKPLALEDLEASIFYLNLDGAPVGPEEPQGRGQLPPFHKCLHNRSLLDLRFQRGSNPGREVNRKTTSSVTGSVLFQDCSACCNKPQLVTLPSRSKPASTEVGQKYFLSFFSPE